LIAYQNFCGPLLANLTIQKIGETTECENIETAIGDVQSNQRRIALIVLRVIMLVVVAVGVQVWVRVKVGV
jgi:hypothetical protein